MSKTPWLTRNYVALVVGFALAVAALVAIAGFQFAVSAVGRVHLTQFGDELYVGTSGEPVVMTHVVAYSHGEVYTCTLNKPILVGAGIRDRARIGRISQLMWSNAQGEPRNAPPLNSGFSGLYLTAGTADAHQAFPSDRP